MFRNINIEYYNQEKILNPPPHVKKEVCLLLKNIDSKKEKIVDFGCGGGRLTIPLLKNEYSVVAIDNDERAIKLLQSITKSINVSKNLSIKTRFPENSKYYYIIGADVLHHINIQKFLRYFKLHLKKNGKIIFSEPNPLNIFWWIFIFLFLNPKQEKGILNCSMFSLKKRLLENGYKDIKIFGFGLFPPQFFKEDSCLSKINYLLGNISIFRLFAYRYIIVAFNK